MPLDRMYDFPALGLLLKVRRVKRDLAWLRRRLRDAPEEIERRRIAALRRLCLRTRRGSPFYRKLWDVSGLSVADLAALRDPSPLPLVSKELFRSARPEDLCSDAGRLRRARLIRTTGSTGQPVQVALDRRMVLFTIALFSRPSMVMHLGIRLESGMDIMVQDSGAIEAQGVREFPQARKHSLDALTPIPGIIEEINRIKPQYIRSYPGIIREVAAEVRRRGIVIWQPEVLVFAGENLTDPILASIQRTFPKAAVTQAYAATEVGGIAVQCISGPGLHVIEYRTILEILDDKGRPVDPGVTGRIVVTDLMNPMTPVVRYAGLGDLGAWAEKPCGCPLSAYPLIGRLDGRTSEEILLPDGTVRHQFVMTTALGELHSIAAFQVRQETKSAVRLILVPEPSADRGEGSASKLREEVLGRIRPLLPGLAVEIEIVANIPREEGSHKTPSVVSRMPRNPES